MIYDLGTPVRLEGRVRDMSGNPANATAMTLTVQRPDGVVTTLTPLINSATGVYYYDYLPPIAGRYVRRFVGTGANAAADEDVFHVASAYTTGVLSLQSAQEVINDEDETRSVELRLYVDAVNAFLERGWGPFAVQAFEEQHSGGGVVLLNHRPVVSITSVTEYAGTTAAVLTPQPLGTPTYTANGYVVDKPSGIVRRVSSGYSSRFADGTGNVHVVYTAGYVETPPEVLLAAKRILQDAWASQRLPSGLPSGLPGATTTEFRAGFTADGDVARLLRPFERARAAL